MYAGIESQVIQSLVVYFSLQKNNNILGIVIFQE